MRILLPVCLACIFSGHQAFTQDTSAGDSAIVHVVVTNSKKKPLKGEEVLFAGTNQRFAGRTDASGKCSFHLSAGTSYFIRLKNMQDTTNYSKFDIPVLKPGEYFSAPFTISIQYDPPRSFTLRNVLFDFGKPTLRPESFKELNEIAEYMLLKDDERYEIAGFTDNVGRDADNIALSQSRAESVKNYLVKKGISASRIVARGYGNAKPVADNTTEEGRQKNRRTEVIIL